MAATKGFSSEEHQHMRWNPLEKSWVLVCPNRTNRPWKGQEEKKIPDDLPVFDPNNPLCPGACRVSGKSNESYESTFVFDNDFPALSPDTPDVPDEGSHPLLKRKSAKGLCRVICFHPHMNKTIPTMTLEEIKDIIKEWVKQYTELSQKWKWVQIFENKGEMMGCSNPHPHGQIWASNFLPTIIEKEEASQLEYYKEHGKSMLLDYIDQEKKVQVGSRVVSENDDWIAMIPYWAYWPYEIILIPKTPVQHLHELTSSQQLSLAEVMKDFLIKYDNLFQCAFPYSMGWHCAPCNGDSETNGCSANDSEDQKHWQLHAHYYPPLLRSASVKKFQAGYEMLAQNQRDITPEKTAAQMRSFTCKHYKEIKRFAKPVTAPVQRTHSNNSNHSSGSPAGGHRDSYRDRSSDRDRDSRDYYNSSRSSHGSYRR